jgi:hypothetical protein
MASLTGIQIPVNQSVEISDPLAIEVQEYNVEKDGKEGFLVSLTVPGIPPKPYEVAGVLTQGEVVVTGTDFSQLVVGDKVVGTGVTANATVKEIRSLTEFVLSAKATGTGEQKLKITPQASALTMVAVEIPLTKMGNTLIIPIRVLEYDGLGGAPQVSEVKQIRLDVGQFFANAGVEKK